MCVQWCSSVVRFVGGHDSVHTTHDYLVNHRPIESMARAAGHVDEGCVCVELFGLSRPRVVVCRMGDSTVPAPCACVGSPRRSSPLSSSWRWTSTAGPASWPLRKQGPPQPAYHDAVVPWRGEVCCHEPTAKKWGVLLLLEIRKLVRGSRSEMFSLRTIFRTIADAKQPDGRWKPRCGGARGVSSRGICRQRVFHCLLAEIVARSVLFVSPGRYGGGSCVDDRGGGVVRVYSAVCAGADPGVPRVDQFVRPEAEQRAPTGSAEVHDGDASECSEVRLAAGVVYSAEGGGASSGSAAVCLFCRPGGTCCSGAGSVA